MLQCTWTLPKGYHGALVRALVAVETEGPTLQRSEGGSVKDDEVKAVLTAIGERMGRARGERTKLLESSPSPDLFRREAMLGVEINSLRFCHDLLSCAMQVGKQ